MKPVRLGYQYATTGKVPAEYKSGGTVMPGTAKMPKMMSPITKAKRANGITGMKKGGRSK